LGEADVVRHKSQREGAGKGDGRRKLPGKKVDHGDREDSRDQRNDTEIPFRFCKGIKLMGKNKKKGRVKVCRVLFIEFYLAIEIIPRIIKRINFIPPERFLIKSVKS